MTRVLVVHHDLGLVGQEADALRRYGYDVVECGVPRGVAAQSWPGDPVDAGDR